MRKLGKTKTIKQRALYVYVPSIEMAERWKTQAEKAGTSTSKFIIEHVENSLRQQEDENYQSRGQIFEELKEMNKVLVEKEKRISHLELLVEKLEEDLRRYRSQLFNDNSESGIRDYERKLVDILLEPGIHSNEEILSRLGVELRESDSVKVISRQLNQLERFGLIRARERGWEWKK